MTSDETTSAQVLPPRDDASARRSVDVERTGLGRYEAVNARGGRVVLGTGLDADFTPVELLLAAIGGCTLVDVDHVVSRRVEPQVLAVEITADKLHDELGHHLGPVTVTFRVSVPQGSAVEATAVVERAARASHERLCTVSRTVMLPTPVTTRIEDEAGTRVVAE